MAEDIDYSTPWSDQARVLRELSGDNHEHTWEWVEDQIEAALRAAFFQGRSGAVTINCDEPAFTVYGRDPFAQSSVISWIERTEAAGVPEAKLNRARERYQEIIDFQSAHPERVKVPD